MKAVFPVYTIADFINQPGKQTEFEIIEFDTMDEPGVDDIHKHSFYEIIWTEKGTSKQTIDDVEYKVMPGSLFFISPNQVHQFEEWKPLKGGTILFTEAFFLLHNTDKNKLFELSFLDNLYTNPCIQLGRKHFAVVQQIIDLIATEQSRPDKSATITQALLHILLEQVQRFADSQTEKPLSKKYLVLFKQFKQMLETCFPENNSTSFYAEQLHITAHHLNGVIKKVTGKTATEIIRERSMLEARRLLSFTDLTVTEIATQLNYFDGSYFAKIFKATTGKTPAAFKKEMSAKYRVR